MSAVVRVWMGELGKLRERVMARRPLMSKAKEEVEKAVEMEANKKDNRAVSVQDDSATMSEAAVFLLMDRFVPW